ncbi:hypothetical protein ANO11243_055470 [Dothideomycetidae sp. 11243]|nr:hypothetical protein ANO11243_055470 [fungal sp. No.11243]
MRLHVEASRAAMCVMAGFEYRTFPMWLHTSGSLIGAWPQLRHSDKMTAAPLVKKVDKSAPARDKSPWIQQKRPNVPPTRNLAGRLAFLSSTASSPSFPVPVDHGRHTTITTPATW